MSARPAAIALSLRVSSFCGTATTPGGPGLVSTCTSDVNSAVNCVYPRYLSKMKCSGCLKTIKEATSLGCNFTTCKRRFCNNCVDAKSLAPDRVNNWLCPECCAQQKKGGDNSSTPIRANIDYDNITLRKRAEASPDVSDTSPRSDIQSLVQEVRLLTREISSLKSKLEEATASLGRCEERLDVMAASVASNESRIGALEGRNSEIDSLKCKVYELQTELDIQAQNNLKNEIEICGIPESPNENTTHMVLLFAQKIGVDLTEQGIDWSTRVGPRTLSAVNAEGNARKHPRPIVVRLLRRNKRDEILKGSKTRRNVTSTDLNLPGPTQKIFTNERLTTKNRMLFRECRTQAKQLEYDYCWCQSGIIYMRKKQGKPATAIRSTADLERLVTKYQKG